MDREIFFINGERKRRTGGACAATSGWWLMGSGVGVFLFLSVLFPPQFLSFHSLLIVGILLFFL